MAKKVIKVTPKVKPKPPIKKKYIETPELLWELFCAYKAKVKSDPYIVKDYVGKDGNEVKRERERPLTIEGFECYLYDEDIIGDLGDYFSNKDKRYTAYATICSRIKKAVRNEQISGGMAGIYNPSITQRLNGLVEKTQQDTTIRLGKDLEEEKYV